ncbi:MAG TPA: Xaa-Pro peptidase family protein [Thermoanaerobaculia bacterium]|nr:Xaa-Pro peptidase family protein [Thermoanaerobaculia bacterium]
MANEKTLSRRGLLAAAPMAAASALLPKPSETAKDAPPLPAPFPPDAFRERQERLRAALKAAGLDAALLVPSTNLEYVGNLETHRSERLMALVVRPGAPSTFITPSFEEERVRRDAVASEVLTWREEEDPIRLLARVLKGASKIGVEGSTDYHTVARLVDATGVKAVDSSPLFDSLRSVKNERERALIADAAARTERAIAATHRRLAEGMTERQIAELLESEFKRQLVRGGGLVQIGPSSALPHGGPGDAVLRSGSVLLIDCGCRVRGYTSDITRTVVFGRPSDEMVRVYAAVDAAQRAALAAFRAGAIPELVDRAARGVIEKAGWGAFFTHRVGHGLGMDGHETPYLVGGNKRPLVAGNVCTLEPGIYLPGKFGVRIEDDFAAKEGGAEPLSTRPTELLTIAS